MILISHRGNINGRVPESENEASYIKTALRSGFFCEIDAYGEQGKLCLGHEVRMPFYKTLAPQDILENPKVLVHCKNLEALQLCQGQKIHYFYHDKEDYTVSSQGWIIAHSNMGAQKGTICMLPEKSGLGKELTNKCAGICSDFISFYE